MNLFEVPLLPWQNELFGRLVAERERLPHALILGGAAGIGKTDFARYLARALLCETPAPLGHPCGQCSACAWMRSGNHPDLYLLRPEAVALEEGAENETDESAGGEGAEASPGGRKSKKAPSKEIRIDEARALAEALSTSSHRGGRRVALIYPADAMNVFTANALLKLLEEPPAGVVFMLVSARSDRLLPTIRSRARWVPMPQPDRQTAAAWLAGRGRAGDAALVAQAEHPGAPLAALAALATEETWGRQRTALFTALRRPDARTALAAAEGLAQCPPGSVVGWLQRWLYDCVSFRLARRIRYYPSEEGAIAALSTRLSLPRALAYGRELQSALRVADHPLNPRLFAEDLLLGYVELW